MKKVIFLLIIIFLVNTQFFLPPYTANQLEKNLKEEVDSYQQLDLEVSSFPALKLLLTAADNVKVTGQNIVIDKLNLSYLNANFRDLKLKEVAGDWEAVRGENTKLQIILAEKDINDYLKTKDELDIFEKLKLDITPKQVILNGVLSLFSAKVNLQLTGDFTVVNGEEIVFNSDKLAVENFLVSTSSIEQLKDKLQFKLDLTEFPLPLAVTKVELKEDKLEIRGAEIENN